MNSGIIFQVDATDGASRRLSVNIEINGPFIENIFEMRFPRWIPGSYLIREPMQHLTDLSATCDGKEISVNRIEVDGIRTKGISDASKLIITYKVLAAEMTCRANHLDASHAHIMPPYTWMLPTRGIDIDRMNEIHEVKLLKPKNWQTASANKRTTIN